MLDRLATLFILTTALLLPAVHGFAYDEAVLKQEFKLSGFKTQGGVAIPEVRIGYETYGHPNRAKDNIVLVTHAFSGNSHAAGKYNPQDPKETVPGYWNEIIGSGKAIDTDKYFVISSDVIANVNTKDPSVITTGPASLDPRTGRPYGMNFPVITIRDMIEVQKALLDSLGVKRIVAVIGPSMGAMQAFTWGVAYPSMVERVIANIPAGIESSPFLIASIDIWADFIRLDPNWNGGDYYGRTEPTEGLAKAFKVISINSRSAEWAESKYSRQFAVANTNPAQSINEKFAVQKSFDDSSVARAKAADANSFLYLVKAAQLYSVRDSLPKLTAKVLYLHDSSDLLMLPAYAKTAVDILKAQGKSVQYEEYSSGAGHIGGLIGIAAVAPKLKFFIENP